MNNSEFPFIKDFFSARLSSDLIQLQTEAKANEFPISWVGQYYAGLELLIPQSEILGRGKRSQEYLDFQHKIEFLITAIYAEGDKEGKRLEVLRKKHAKIHKGMFTLKVSLFIFMLITLDVVASYFNYHNFVFVFEETVSVIALVAFAICFSFSNVLFALLKNKTMVKKSSMLLPIDMVIHLALTIIPFNGYEWIGQLFVVTYYAGQMYFILKAIVEILKDERYLPEY